MDVPITPGRGDLGCRRFASHEAIHDGAESLSLSLVTTSCLDGVGSAARSFLSFLLKMRGLETDVLTIIENACYVRTEYHERKRYYYYYRDLACGAESWDTAHDAYKTLISSKTLFIDLQAL